MSSRTTWLGLAGSAGTTVVIGGSVSYVGFVNMENPQATMQCGVSGMRLGAAAHLGGNISLAIMTGVSGKSNVSGLKSGGVDFAVDIGAKWGDTLKVGGRTAQVLKLLGKVDDLPKLKVWANSERAKIAINALTGDLELSHTKPSFAMFSVPFAGAGVGAGVWYEWQSIHAFDGARAWNFFKPVWRLYKHMGQIWLQMGNIPAEDGTTIIVNFREGVWGRDKSLEVTEPFLDGTSSVIAGTVQDNLLVEDDQSAPIARNAPPHGGLNLSKRTLAGRWTRNGVARCAAGEKIDIALDVAVDGKSVWETDQYVQIVTDRSGDFGTIINPGNRWRK